MLFCWAKSCVSPSAVIQLPELRTKDLDREDEVPLRQVEWNVLEPYHKRDNANKKQREDIKAQVLQEQKGFSKEGGEGDGY